MLSFSVPSFFVIFYVFDPIEGGGSPQRKGPSFDNVVVVKHLLCSSNLVGGYEVLEILWRSAITTRPLDINLCQPAVAQIICSDLAILLHNFRVRFLDFMFYDRPPYLQIILSNVYIFQVDCAGFYSVSIPWS